MICRFKLANLFIALVIFSIPSYGQVGCLQNLTIPLDQNCQTNLTSALLTLPAPSNYMVWADRNEVPSNLNSSQASTTYTIDGAGTWHYGVYESTLGSNGKHAMVCSGSLTAEDKIKPQFTSSTYTQYGTFKKINHKEWVGTLGSADPSFRPAQWSCWQSTNHADLNFTWPHGQDRKYDILSIVPSFSGYMTIVAQSDDFDPTLAVYSKPLDASQPCNNLIAFGESALYANPLAGLGQTNGSIYAPWILSEDPIVHMQAKVTAGRTYYVVITHRDAKTGSYQVNFLRTDVESNIAVGITSPESPNLLIEKTSYNYFELLCADVAKVQLNQTLKLDQTKYSGGSLDDFGVQTTAELDQLWRNRAATLLAPPVESAHQSEVDVSEFFVDSMLIQYGFAPLVQENCGNWEVSISDQRVQLGDCGNGTYSTKIVRNYNVALPNNGTVADRATVEMLFRNLTLHDVNLPPYSVTLNCNEPVDAGYPFVVTLGGYEELRPNGSLCNLGAGYTDMGSVNECGGSGSFTRRWTLYDFCRPGQTIIYNQIIRIGGDQDNGPLVDIEGQLDFEVVEETCQLNVRATRGSAHLSACTGNVADIELVVYHQGFPTAIIGTLEADATNETLILEDVSPGNYTAQWTLTDACGRTTTYQKNIQVKTDCTLTGSVSGQIMDPNQNKISEAQIKITYKDQLLNTQNSDKNGQYLFENIELDKTYLIEVEKEDLPTNGLSTKDIIQIQKHIIGIEPLSSPFALMAADFDASGSISILDIIQIRRLLLGYDFSNTEFEKWLFIPQAHANQLDVDALPLAIDLMSGIELHLEQTNTSSVDFIGINKGDVDMSYLQDIETRDAQKETWKVQYQSIADGQEVEVKIIANETGLANIDGFQGAFQWNSALNLLGWESENLTASHLNVHENHLSFSWNGDLKNKEIITLRFKMPQQNHLNDLFKISNRQLNAEVYLKNGITQSLDLTFENLNEPELISAFPNPFTSGLEISYEGKEQELKLYLFDIHGKLLETKKIGNSKSHQKTTLETPDLPEGTYFIQVKGDTFNQVLKVVKQ